MRNVAIDEYINKSFTESHGLSRNSSTRLVYDYTNELMKYYMKLLNTSGKVATVGSSGDQAFYSIFKGAEEVVVIDGNPYAPPMIDLKRNAILNMKRNEFFQFWRYENVFRPKFLRNFLGDLNKDSAEFFQEVISDIGYSTDSDKFYYSVARSILGYGFEPLDGADIPTFAKNCEFYESDRAFNQLKERLSQAKISFQTAELTEFPKVLDGRFSTIMLSNVKDYVDNKDFFATADALIENNMQKGGTMQMYYDFNYGINTTFNESMAEAGEKTRICDMYHIRPSHKSIQKVEFEPEKIDYTDRMMYVYERY